MTPTRFDPTNLFPSLWGNPEVSPFCPVPRASVAAQPARSPRQELFLNSISEYPLSAFDSLGAFVEEAEKRLMSGSDGIQTVLSGVFQPSAVQQSLDSIYLDNAANQVRHTTIDRDFIARHWPSDFAPGPLARGISGAGGVLDAVTGVLSVAKSFHQDRVAGDELYPRTMGSTLSSVAQISSATGVGALAGGLVAGVAGGLALPLAVGGLAAIGTGYAVGKVFDYFFS